MIGKPEMLVDKSKPRLLLETLASHEGWHAGLELVAFEPKIRRGTMYVYLAQLEDSGFVRSRYRQGDYDPRVGRRREYEITSRGRAALLRDDL